MPPLPSIARQHPWPAPSPQAWARGFEDLEREHGWEPLRVEGRLPADLVGTLYRVGPARFSAFGQRWRHWFDGDGAVTAVRLGGGARGAVRFVHTRHRAEELRAGRPRYLRYGTVIPGGPLHRMRAPPYNAASTALLHWQGRLLALYEPCPPTEVHPHTLDTLGETDLGGAVLQAFGAHPHRVPERRATYNIGTRFGPTRMEVDLFELPDAGPARRLASLPLPRMTLVHDFVATPHHLVLLVPPVRMRLLPLLLGKEPLAHNLRYEPALGTEVIIVPLDGGQPPVRFTVEPFFQWHFANGFEREGELVLDVVRYEDFASNRLMGELLGGEVSAESTGRLHRLRIHPGRRTLTSEQLWEETCEHPQTSPAVAGRDGRYLYTVASSPEARRGMPDLLARWDHRRGRAVTVAPGPGQYPSEPLFVPRPGATAEDDGYLLSLVYDGLHHASHLAVFEPRRLEAGPLARAWFAQPIPFTVHGTWVPG